MEEEVVEVVAVAVVAEMEAVEEVVAEGPLQDRQDFQNRLYRQQAAPDTGPQFLCDLSLASSA